MDSLRTLPADQQNTYLAHCARGRAAWQDHQDIVDANVHFMRAWEVIPEPKLDHDETSSFLSGYLDFLRDTGQLDKAGPWLERLSACYGPDDPHSLFKSAEFHYLSGRLDDAFALFDRLHRAWGNRPFAGEDPAYLAFYRQRRGRASHT